MAGRRRRYPSAASRARLLDQPEAEGASRKKAKKPNATGSRPQTVATSEKPSNTSVVTRAAGMKGIKNKYAILRYINLIL